MGEERKGGVWFSYWNSNPWLGRESRAMPDPQPEGEGYAPAPSVQRASSVAAAAPTHAARGYAGEHLHEYLTEAPYCAEPEHYAEAATGFSSDEESSSGYAARPNTNAVEVSSAT